MLHTRTHPEFVDGCFGCKVGSLQINSGECRTLAEKYKHAELDQYERARAEGSQPMGTLGGKPEKALRFADTHGRPYRADDLGGTYYPELKPTLTGAPLATEPV